MWGKGEGYVGKKGRGMGEEERDIRGEREGYRKRKVKGMEMILGY